MSGEVEELEKAVSTKDEDAITKFTLNHTNLQCVKPGNFKGVVPSRKNNEEVFALQTKKLFKIKNGQVKKILL